MTIWEKIQWVCVAVNTGWAATGEIFNFATAIAILGMIACNDELNRRDALDRNPAIRERNMLRALQERYARGELDLETLERVVEYTIAKNRD